VRDGKKWKRATKVKQREGRGSRPEEVEGGVDGGDGGEAMGPDGAGERVEGTKW